VPLHRLNFGLSLSTLGVAVLGETHVFSCFGVLRSSSPEWLDGPVVVDFLLNLWHHRLDVAVVLEALRALAVVAVHQMTHR